MTFNLLTTSVLSWRSTKLDQVIIKKKKEKRKKKVKREEQAESKKAALNGNHWMVSNCRPVSSKKERKREGVRKFSSLYPLLLTPTKTHQDELDIN